MAVEVLRGVGTEVDMVIERLPGDGSDTGRADATTAATKPSQAAASGSPPSCITDTQPVSQADVTDTRPVSQADVTETQPLSQAEVTDTQPLSQADALLVTLQKDDNGLGFSIAGGKGSAPLRNDSEVVIYSFIYL